MATAEKLVDYAKSMFAAFASLSATAFFARSILNEMLPREVVEYTKSIMESILSNKFRKEITLTIDELHGCETNQIFKAAELYLGTHIRNSSALVLAQSLKVSKISEDMPITVGLDSDPEIVDKFEGVKFYWVLKCERIKHTRGRTEVRTFNLKFPRSNKEMALEKYIPYILNEADLIKKGARKIKLFTLTNDVCIGHQWESTNLNHPATLETLALDPELKQMLFDDLDRFLSRKKYYRQVGKAWRRGYLLYGPPGTGKSSLIAAMANYLKFDVYDLDLGMLKSDSQLRTILLETANRSILVVEDIDCCSVDVQVREDSSDEGHPSKGKVTLSGLLNFIDGLWSSCGDERIIIFTTNHKDKLDPALLRPGRMDMHINMSNCTPSVFRILVDNYLGVKSHELFEQIERLIEEKEFTPAEIAEQLMKDDDPNSALQGLLCFLGSKKIETAAIFEKLNRNLKNLYNKY